MLQFIIITMKGLFRDRVFQGVMMSAVFFILIPSISSLSMRQVTELSITLSFSLLSAIVLFLSVFLGGSSLWKDMERRYSFSVLGLPMTRTSYLLGKFFGIALFLLLTTLVLGALGCAVVGYTSGLYPPTRPVIWMNVILSLLFVSLKYILVVAFAFLLSTVSTSFFLPIFGSITVFFVGNATQQVYDYLHSAYGQTYAPFIKKTATLLYYLLPNFSAFDLTVNAIYGIDLSASGLLLTAGYFIMYTAIVLTIATIVFSRREIK